jgi:NAD(P)-dependent dehydrogenase (short-subunit alcohol dehydrogenase family)
VIRRSGDREEGDLINQSSPLFDLTDRVALITGGSRGLGRVMALGFAQAGADIVVASRDGEACRTVVADITESTHRRGFAYPVNVSHWDELDGLVESSYEHFGRVDILVNNAGISPIFDRLTDVTESLFDKVVAVNLKGPFRLTSLVGSRMANDGGGSIINISSAGAVHPRPGILPYAAAKAGLNALTVGFARAFGPSVRCNGIMPGTFLTDIAKAWDMDDFERRSQGFALQRGGQPNEILGTALYLASNASSYTTGTIVTVDGGQP